MENEIRPGRLTDLEALKAIDSFYLDGHTERADEIADWLRGGQAYVAMDRGAACAYAALGHAYFRKPTIEMLMVAETHRRKGIARQLVGWLEAQAAGPEIWTSTNLSNHPMQRLLASLGYELTGFINNLDPGDPELFFYKKLNN